MLNIYFKFIDNKINISINDVLAKSEDFILKCADFPIYRSFKTTLLIGPCILFCYFLTYRQSWQRFGSAHAEGV